MMKSWAEETPPRETWVVARYETSDIDRILKTCKHGCCVLDPGLGSMMLPKYWRLATEDEVRSVLLEYDRFLTSKVELDVSDITTD